VKLTNVYQGFIIKGIGCSDKGSHSRVLGAVARVYTQGYWVQCLGSMNRECGLVPRSEANFFMRRSNHTQPESFQEVKFLGLKNHTFFARRSPCTIGGSHAWRKRMPLTMSLSICSTISGSSSNVWFISMSDRLPLSHSSVTRRGGPSQPTIAP
jgi:hypothetical protein